MEEERSVNVNGKRPWVPASPLTLADGDEEEDELDYHLAAFVLGEETVMEVMKVLEEELNTTNKGSCCSSNHAPSKINETCGPSFSDSSSSIMASNDMSDIGIFYLMEHSQGFSFTYPTSLNLIAEEEPSGSGSASGSVSGSGSGYVDDEINGGDCKESVDEWLERVLSGAHDSTFQFDGDDDDDEDEEEEEEEQEMELV